MATGKVNIPRFHEDRDFLRAAVNYTSAETAFLPRLIEKDYFCTVLLLCLTRIDGLVFKGGTSLAKVYADFYRLSEDLDFVLPMPEESGKKERSKKVKPAKDVLNEIGKKVPAFRLAQPLTGANESRQYIAIVEYNSILSDGNESIKVELAFGNPSWSGQSSRPPGQF